MSDVACAKIGDHVIPLDALPADLRRRWHLAQSKIELAKTDDGRAEARRELSLVSSDIVATLGPTLAIKAAPSLRIRNNLSRG